MLRQEAERGQGAVATKTVEDWDKFSAIPTVLFVTNCLTPYRQAMLDAWAAAGRVAIDVLLTMRDGDTKRGWGDTRVSGKGWRMIPGAVPRDIGKYGAVFLGGWDSAIDYLISLVAQMRRVPVLAVIDGVAPSHVAEGCHGLKSVQPVPSR
jgi:hypothetical protein